LPQYFLVVEVPCNLQPEIFLPSSTTKLKDSKQASSRTTLADKGRPYYSRYYLSNFHAKNLLC